MAGFAGARRPHPGRHTATPAAFRYPLAVSYAHQWLPRCAVGTIRAFLVR
jgi:hypothetical protein